MCSTIRKSQGPKARRDPNAIIFSAHSASLRLVWSSTATQKAGARFLRTANRNLSGFSLVEVMCAILILGIALVGFVQGITTALGSSKESELQTTAALLAAGQIEKLRAEGEIEDGTSDGEWGDDFSNYQWKQTISTTSIKGLYEIDLVVESTPSGKQIYELRTMLFEPYVVQETEQKSRNKRDRSRKRNRGSEP